MKILKLLSPGFLSLGFVAVGLSCMTLGTCSAPSPAATAFHHEEEPAQEPESLLSAK